MEKIEDSFSLKFHFDFQSCSILLPKSIKSYASFNNHSPYHLDTHIGKIKINPFYAFSHLTKNTNNQNRFRFTGAFFDIMESPLIISKGEYYDKNKEKTVESFTFYKPYIHKEKIYHLINIITKEEDGLIQKTFFNVSSPKKIVSLLKENEIVFSDPKVNELLETVKQMPTRGANDESISHKNICVKSQKEEISNICKNITSNTPLEEHEDSFLVDIVKDFENKNLPFENQELSNKDEDKKINKRKNR